MDERLNILIDAKIKKALEEKAKSMGLTLSSYVRLVLMQSINQK